MIIFVNNNCKSEYKKEYKNDSKNEEPLFDIEDLELKLIIGDFRIKYLLLKTLHDSSYELCIEEKECFKEYNEENYDEKQYCSYPTYKATHPFFHLFLSIINKNACTFIKFVLSSPPNCKIIFSRFRQDHTH